LHICICNSWFWYWFNCKIKSFWSIYSYCGYVCGQTWDPFTFKCTLAGSL